jgi:phenylacetate-coenzyme A ligase PaaK-like adenylate-forming protein
LNVPDKISKRIFEIEDSSAFNELALQIFHHQYENNLVYRQFADLLGIRKNEVDFIEKIPYLPVELFKSHKIITGTGNPETVFISSATTGLVPSSHFVSDIGVYEKSFLKCFEQFYGAVDQYCILALLPSYLERSGSSLVFMADKLIRLSGHQDSGFYLYENEKLIQLLRKLEEQGQKTILLGVSFALADLAEQANLKLNTTIVIETGGMKGRRKEMVREELHEILKSCFGVKDVHSEYGMTELLSQAYSHGNGIFKCPPWMKVLIRDSNDPLSLIGDEKTGGINIIDLANINSCSFISVQDLGKTHFDGTFEVLGRFDASDIRGCNLMTV